MILVHLNSIKSLGFLIELLTLRNLMICWIFRRHFMVNVFLSLLLMWIYSILVNVISLFIFQKLLIIFICLVSIYIISYSIIKSILLRSSFLILHCSWYLLFISFIVIIVLCHLILELSLTLSWVWPIIRNLIN